MDHIYLPVLPGLEMWLNNQPDPVAVLTEALIRIRQRKSGHTVNSYELVVEPCKDEKKSGDE